MKLNVYDTYVHAIDGSLVHFDVLVPESTDSDAVQIAKQWLGKMGISYSRFEQDNCRFCHSEIATPEIEQQIKRQGYFILQLEGCPAFL